MLIFQLEKNVSFPISTFSFHIPPQRGKNSICVEPQDKKSITPITGSTGLSRLTSQTLCRQFGCGSSVLWPIPLASAQLMQTLMEGAEFSIGVDNLWALIIVHHPRAIKPEKKLWISSLRCENPHPSRTSLFPGYLSRGMNAHSLEPGNGKPFFTAWSIPLISALLWAKLFPYRSFPSHPVSQWVFTQNCKELKNPDHTPATQP